MTNLEQRSLTSLSERLKDIFGTFGEKKKAGCLMGTGISYVINLRTK